MGALSIIRTDFCSRDGNKYLSNHPSNPTAFKPPSKIIGAIKSFFLFLLPAPKFSLFFLFPVLSPLTFFPLFDPAYKHSWISSNPLSSIYIRLSTPYSLINSLRSLYYFILSSLFLSLYLNSFFFG
jgi:hypothetical protein